MQREPLYRLGVYVLDAERMVLRREDEVVGLPPKALAILVALVEQQGEVVSKQQLMQKVWPESYVEEGNLTQNIFLLRRELGRAPDGLDYIQTLSKRGYRINVPVERLARDVAAVSRKEMALPAETEVRTAIGPVAKPVWIAPRFVAVVVLSIAVLGLGLGFLWHMEAAAPRVSDFTQLTHDGAVKRGRLQTAAGPDAALFTDGSRIYFTEGSSDSLSLAQVSASGGETAQIATQSIGSQLLDVSRVRSEMLVSGRGGSASPGSLWTVPIPAGEPREIGGIRAWDGSWSPDGRWIAFTNGTDLSVARADGTEQRKLATLPGTAWMPRWSPDGQRIRLTVYNTQQSGDSLWQVNSNGSGLQRLFQAWESKDDAPSVCCGSWTPDGRNFVFQSTRAGRSEVWAVPDRPKWLQWMPWLSSTPVQLTGGQLNSVAPVVSPDGKRLFVIGQQLRGELQRFDPLSRQFVSYLGGRSMDFLSFSRDGKWMTWVEFPERTLWRSRADGSERLQLTFAPLHTMMPRWSPDDTEIVFYAGGGGGGQRAYIVSANGGQLKPLGGGKEMLPQWSPDGGSILHSEFPFFAANPRKIALHVLDLKTHQSEVIPGSDGLFAAQWSPDGRYIAALALEGSKIRLFDVQTKTWAELGRGSGFLNWSRDSKYLYCLQEGVAPAVVRLRVGDGEVEVVASLKGIRESGQLAGLEFGLNPEGDPYILRDIGTQEIYSLVWHDR